MCDITHQNELNELANLGYFDDAVEDTPIRKATKHDISTPEKMTELQSQVIEELKDFNKCLSLNLSELEELGKLSELIDEHYPNQFVKIMVDYDFICQLIITTEDYMNEKGYEEIVEENKRKLFAVIMADIQKQQEQTE